MMGYFRANERYLGGGDDSRVDPPWGVRVQDAGMAGRVRVTWRRPYTPVDSYGVYGQPDGPNAPAWQELARVPGSASESLLHLAVGAWRLAVRARRGERDSDLSDVAIWQGSEITVRDQGSGIRDQGSAMAMDTPQAASRKPQAAIASPQPPTPAEPQCPLPGCGARVAVQADGSAACVYCGGLVAITLDGRVLPLDRLLYGACACCVPRHPLIRQGDALHCPAHPERLYTLPAGQGTGPTDNQPSPTPNPQPLTPEFDWTAIDTALRDNSARLGRHGLFVRERPR